MILILGAHEDKIRELFMGSKSNKMIFTDIENGNLFFILRNRMTCVRCYIVPIFARSVTSITKVVSLYEILVLFKEKVGIIESDYK